MPKYIPFPAYYDCAPLDISYIFADEKPAGKHGFLQCKGDNFYFEDGTLVRFWGTNLNAGACFPDKDYEPKAATTLAELDAIVWDYGAASASGIIDRLIAGGN